MNPEKFSQVAREEQERQEKETRVKAEHTAKYQEALRIEQGLIPRLLDLFDKHSVQKKDAVRQKQFVFAKDEATARVAMTTITVNYKIIQEPGPLEHNWRGATKPSKPTEVITDDVRAISICTMSDNLEVLESHTIFIDDLSSDASEESVRSHFYKPQSERHRYPDQILQHMRDIKETVDHIISSNPVDQVPGVQPSV